ncbi:MAG: cyclopropane fatty acyl phospholipid synthase [Thermodesulfovibrionales bacterium]|nr:cyclopropane fatty acyl phospholipid synthase [Thermodesulfovibrionales bacterium]
MGIGKVRGIIQEILDPAGITIDGSRPWDLRIQDERFFRRVFRDGSLGLGESFMEGWWKSDRLDEFFCRIMPLRLEETIRNNLKLQYNILKAVVFNLASRSRAFAVGEKHYDLGNELFRRMLDRRMVYSCGYWQNAGNLDEAQEAKLDLVCRKLGFQPGDRVLDIGCGWGGFARYAAKRYGVSIVGITISREQAALAKDICAGLPVDIRIQDYRDVKEPFDHIVSIGMFEHVCYKNYRKYMEVVHRCLKEDGLFLLHTIGDSCSNVIIDPWFEKYIFPNSMIPSMEQISESAEKLYVIEDWHNFGLYYDPTLMSWFDNFDRNWDVLHEFYDDRFYRMWKYYLLSCAGTFRSQCLQVWQLVLTKRRVPGGYTPVR